MRKEGLTAAPQRVITLTEKISRVLVKSSRIIAWFVVVTVLYFAGVWLVETLKQYSLSAGCPQVLTHKFGAIESSTGSTNHVGWCQTWWWHPLRLVVTLGIGGLVGACLFITSTFLRLGKRVFVFPVVLIFLEWIITDLPGQGYQNSVQWACRWGIHHRISAQECATQLGEFGDIRLYFPVAVIGCFWALQAVRRRTE